ncbi:YgiQ family radical SAM protein [Carboxydocella sp. JDF658]|uniref:YgiQ family radical SAM protein n=1 Tax=Carboxydocella sp. JDF658 TaxID=1926600 RepID=UPI0009AE54CD|nr:YgiQ family radical SAM protein [Carboxydocella sp. JDF658]GAW32806.1 YgiQ family radical SAM protein [Carboxydocella sp. JDF658]
MQQPEFVPMSKEEMSNLGWHYLDFILITGDAYVDHPSFGSAIISRVLIENGFKVGIIAQPNWKKKDDFKKLGAPRFGFLVTAGNLDSMVNHYTAAKKRRKRDAYSPGGKMGLRPDYPTLVYTQVIKEIFPDKKVILGGIEASLRRFAHYDFWQDKILPSFLILSGADLLLYGMAEKSIVELALELKKGSKGNYKNIRGLCYVASKEEIGTLDPKNVIFLPDYESICRDKLVYAEAFRKQYLEQDPFWGKILIQPYRDKGFLVQNPPAFPLKETEFDQIYELPFQRKWHPIYDKDGGVPALSEVIFSITANRGCYGGCNFCALTMHQGRIVQSRSKESIVEEAKKLVNQPEFKGYIHDIGGPTANFLGPACSKQAVAGACKNRQCLFPEPCEHLKPRHDKFLEILRSVRNLKGIKKVFVRSGIRYDYLLADREKEKIVEELCKHHISGQLKVAPEHISKVVLYCMGKPAIEQFEEFKQLYELTNRRLGLKQYLVPYLMSSHPGSTLEDAVKLAVYLKKNKMKVEQVQDFIPTPGSLSTTMYYTGINPLTGKKVYVPKSMHDKALQRALIQYWLPQNYHLVKEALIKTGHSELIGNGPGCLIPAKPPKIDIQQRS